MTYPYRLTLEAALKLDPCLEARVRLPKILPKRRKMDAAQARALGCTFDDLLWIADELAQSDKTLARRLADYINDNAKAILHLWEKQYPADDRPHKAIETGEAFLAGAGTKDEWEEAAWAAHAAWVTRTAWVAHVAWVARTAWAVRAAWGAWGARGARAAWKTPAAREAFKDWQFDRLIYWLTEEHPEPLPMPAKGVPALPEIAKLEEAA